MGKAKIVVGLIALAGVAMAGWQVASCEIANTELQSDLHDLAAQIGTRIGLDPQKSDDELRASVIRKAENLGIHLEPNQVSVQRTGESEGTSRAPVVVLAVDYTARVNLLVYSFSLHFNPSSTK